MTSKGAYRQGAGRRGAVLVFDADDRLSAWNEEAEALPGAGRLLVQGALPETLAPLFRGLPPGHTVTDWPLSGGGFVRRTAGEGAADEGVSGNGAAAGADLSGRLFAAASHDLRQPLAALSLLLGALEGRLDGTAVGGGKSAAGRGSAPADPAARDLLNAMGNAVQSLRGMVDGHFDLVRLEAGLVQPDIGAPVVNGILTRMALDAAPRFDGRGLRFSVLPCSVRVATDASLLERILQGFIANTLRHTERGRVVLGCRRQGADLRIELWSTGRGLLPEQLRTLREELQRPDGAGDPSVIDLGLRLACGLARRLGHRLEVDSAPGRGTMLAVLVPRTADGADEPPAFAEPAGPAGVNATTPGEDVSRARVLVIEDDPMVLEALGALLGQWGCAVVAADSVDAALERLGPGPQVPDLVISDLRLKGAMNGIVAIRQIGKALDATLPGLILTGDTDPMRLREARLSGYPLLHKPVAPMALRGAVARLLGRERLKS
ncbi:hybrid sensor histidine kinase/response regulator [Azospirillum brasilense]|uniref:hybrid sensor histidine kinase/response regulator n=1 Tax=Azospirillum brasilense TaxID=192 RepID=UPI000E67D0B0|nr:hybrid sensor histidine kinase/response regulator [Azospirillum brasilense]NUB26096.1 response regulator [Azospirillum brasilense]NUB32670.1 response regulator [Azospirillum brasilense]RIW05917.1 response regulator [Azospirillum brasilense]